MAGDWNARNTDWGDKNINERGVLLYNWVEDAGILNKTTLYTPNKPTFPSAGSFLDHCLADSRITLRGLINGKLITLPYDSDHNAISFKIDCNNFLKGISSITPTPVRYNYKKANWTRFADHLENNITEHLPHDRNLTINEIDTNILKLENYIQDAISTTIPIVKDNTKKGCQKYVNHKIIKLHRYKSALVAELFKNKDNKEQVKTVIKMVNKQLITEFRNAETALWESLAKNINYRDSSKFFPNINRHFRYKEPPRIDTLKINKNSPLISELTLNNTSLAVDNNNNYIIDQPTTKLNIIGNYFETINSPRYTNIGTPTKHLADLAAEDIKTRIDSLRRFNNTHTNFSKTNPAHYPTLNQDTSNYLHTYIQVALTLKTAKNKTSSGIDNIPMIVLKHLPTSVVKDYTIILNNCFNHSYYPTRWKKAKVIPIKKKDKDHSKPASYRPISLTVNISKIFEKLIKTQLMTHVNNNNILPDQQYGFRARHSTVHAINKFASDINRHLLNGKLVGTALIDLEKAFDSVWLNGLIYVLIQMNFPVSLILLIYDMIHGKSFIVWDGTNISTLTFNILEGLQQGTVTSPILFIIYTSKILNKFGLNSNNNTHSGAYADDEVVYVADNKITTIQDKLTKIVNDKYHCYKLWNLKMNPDKSETILFRKTVNEISPLTVPLIKTFQITITDKDSGEIFNIPNKDTVKYLGIHFDYLIRMNKHHAIQLKKAKNAFRANSRIFYNRNIQTKAKLICYQLLVRPIFSYAAPIWWNVGPSVMEKYRRFERSCLKTCLGKYRSAESNYIKRLSNSEIYDQADITRFDCFCLTLTRNYFSTIYEIGNDAINKLKVENPELARRMAGSNYSPPELFTNLDRMGCIQNEYNVPIIYHIRRHCARKAIYTDMDHIPPESIVYSTALPTRDRDSLDRLSEKYWWLQGEAKQLDELRRRARLKKQQNEQQQRARPRLNSQRLNRQ
ncbi:uncharacterized protein LOC128667485 [Microplitis demolitor]|uniref:uncharacterized protein LOC128667485 n=1 Tax=Microplitis demolitor TaxID=69319 RepID=UPI00235B5BE8|nr:uncharacterized protein LOC128667485 [Microplitis demolitor]